VPELVARIVLFAVAVPAGLVLAILTGVAAYGAARAGQGVRAAAAVSGLFFGVWQTWTVVALSLSEREGLDLGRYLVYPIQPSRLFGYGIGASVLGDPFAVFWCLLLGGAFVGGALARPGPAVILLALAYLLFVVATVAFVALLQEVLARLLRARRARVLAVAAIYAGTALAVAWTAGRPGALRELLEVLRALRYVAFPATLASGAVRALYAGDTAGALPFLAGLALAGLACLVVAYRLALASARSGGTGAPRAGATGTAGWRLPGRFGALVEKEAKYVLRHPLSTVLALVLPALAGLVTWRLAPHLASEGAVVRALPIFGFAMYAHVAAQVFWLNGFGWERGGGRTWFLAPLPLAEVLLAKNLAAYGFSLALFLASAAAGIAAGGAPPAWALAAALALHAGAAPWLLVPGNLVSILVPRAAALTIQRGGSLSPLSSLGGLAIFAAASALFSVPLLLAMGLDRPLVLAAWGGLGVAGVALYAATLPRVSRLLEHRREEVLEAVEAQE
jgi:ABC-2 type transport system permease protein